MCTLLLQRFVVHDVSYRADIVSNMTAAKGAVGSNAALISGEGGPGASTTQTTEGVPARTVLLHWTWDR